MSAPVLLRYVEEYIALRRSLGFAMIGPATLLREFARFAASTAHQGPLTIDLAVRWAEASGSRDPAASARRLGALRGFARYRVAFDPATEVPPRGLLGHPVTRKTPHLYTGAEIEALLGAAAEILPRRGLRPFTYVTFFALLASTGLRLSEACQLACRDVDLHDGILHVREGKFHKSRLVPLHPSAIEPLFRYVARRDHARGIPCSDAFFRTEYAASLTSLAAQMVFIRLRRRLGWTSLGRARLPRIHDIRHTFAMRCLLQWSKEGIDVNRKIAALSTYLGHAQVSGTYWYLTACPELMAVAAGRFEALALPGREHAS